jgi:hypothetical protein
MNDPAPTISSGTVITCSHFLPRIGHSYARAFHRDVGNTDDTIGSLCNMTAIRDMTKRILAGECRPTGVP